jgi:hypothetical protein
MALCYRFSLNLASL